MLVIVSNTPLATKFNAPGSPPKKLVDCIFPPAYKSLIGNSYPPVAVVAEPTAVP